MLPCTLPIFHDKYPNVRIDLHEANSESLIQMIIEGDIDLAFFNFVEANPALAYTVISHEELVLVMSAQHPFTRYGRKRPGCKYPSFTKRPRFYPSKPDAAHTADCG
ncbi:LysR substrate-binding domain-containing protein [Acidaminococcus intestini]